MLKHALSEGGWLRDPSHGLWWIVAGRPHKPLRVPQTVPEADPFGISSFLSYTPVRPAGVSVRSRHAPSHMALVFLTFNFAPVALISRNNCCNEVKSLTKQVALSAFWLILKWVPLALGSRKPDIGGL